MGGRGDAARRKLGPRRQQVFPACRPPACSHAGRKTVARPRGSHSGWHAAPRHTRSPPAVVIGPRYSWRSNDGIREAAASTRLTAQHPPTKTATMLPLTTEGLHPCCCCAAATIVTPTFSALPALTCAWCCPHRCLRCCRNTCVEPQAGLKLSQPLI